MDAARIFDDWARRGRAEGMEAGHLQTAGPTLAALDLDGKRFLDLGCGNGWAARFAADKGATSDGLDASNEMVDRAAAAGNARTTFQQGDFAHLPFDDGAFDVVWSMEAVYYAPDPDAVLAEVARVLAPGGVFHMLIDFYGENVDSHCWPDDVGVHMSLRSESDWVAAFEQAGMQATAKRLRSDDPAADDWKRTQGTLHVRGQA